MFKTLATAALCAADIQRQRNALARLTDDQLSDIGLTRREADREATRPFWDAPAPWKRPTPVVAVGARRAA